ncbi:MAG TPA: TrbI/VirB10 family protein [Vicinamibacterales bacterium]|nr:TrbI/VirB10 family protein [Vicinamibacterales bacterium]
MEISRAAVGLFAASCVAAGAAGAYLSTRGTGPRPITREEAAVLEMPPPAPVEESEGVVGLVDPAPTAPSAPAPPPSRPPARVEARRPTPETRPASADRRSAPAPATAPRAVPVPLEPPPLVVNTPLPPPEPAAPEVEELVVAADSVIGLQLETTLSSEQARVEDPVVARITRDVKVGDRVVIPAGSRAHGEVTLVERGGRLRERARLGVRFTSIVLADGTRLPITTQTVYREGDPPGNESAAKIGGGAIGGAIIGGILGGAKGAAIGGAVGAGAGTGAVLAGGRNPATLPAGSPITVRLEEPVVVTVER